MTSYTQLYVMHYASINQCGYDLHVEMARRLISNSGTSTGFSPENLRGGKSLEAYADTSPLQPSGDYSN
jgi:hypothetical protein